MMHFPTLLRAPLARLFRSLPVPGRWRVAPLLNSLFNADKAEVHIPQLGHLRLDLSEECQVQIFWTGLNREDRRINRLMQRALPSDGVFLDVGANIGIHTLAAANLTAGGGAVLAFEPHPQNYQTLIYNLDQNRLRHVIPYNVGLADAPDVITCQGVARGGNWSLASRSGEFSFDLRLVRLDDLILEQPLPRIDLIKIDVEGAEVRVLRGARKTLARFRPLVIFEVCQGWLSRMHTSPHELLATLEELGYSAHTLSDGEALWGRSVTVTELTRMPPWDWTNLVAVPTSALAQQSPDSQVVSSVASL